MLGALACAIALCIMTDEWVVGVDHSIYKTGSFD
jgi:hypothetical protein